MMTSSLEVQESNETNFRLVMLFCATLFTCHPDTVSQSRFFVCTNLLILKLMTENWCHLIPKPLTLRSSFTTCGYFGLHLASRPQKHLRCTSVTLFATFRFRDWPHLWCKDQIVYTRCSISKIVHAIGSFSDRQEIVFTNCPDSQQYICLTKSSQKMPFQSKLNAT